VTFHCQVVPAEGSCSLGEPAISNVVQSAQSCGQQHAKML
jgi:hypothetical protein